MSGATSVYLYYDSNDVLLYVGITSRGSSRNGEHNRTKSWWPYVARQEVRHYPSRGEAEDVERSLIRRIRPPFNRQHNPDHAVKSAAYLAYAPPPATSPTILECTVCRDLIDGAFRIYLDSDELSEATRSNKQWEEFEWADSSMKALSACDDVLALVRASATAAQAAAGLERLLGISADHAERIVEKPIHWFAEDSRRLTSLHHRELEGTVKTPTLAEWRIAHQGCVEETDSSIDFPAAPNLSTLVFLAWQFQIHCPWVRYTNWVQFAPTIGK